MTDNESVQTKPLFESHVAGALALNLRIPPDPLHGNLGKAVSNCKQMTLFHFTFRIFCSIIGSSPKTPPVYFPKSALGSALCSELRLSPWLSGLHRVSAVCVCAMASPSLPARK